MPVVGRRCGDAGGEVKVTMLLADAAQAVGGKLYVLGGGWSVTGPAPTAMAIALKIDVPWDQAMVRHHWVLELIDEDGHPVSTPSPEGGRPVQVSGSFEVGRPSTVAEGTPLDLPLAVNIGPLPLPAGRRCVWRLSIDGVTAPDWQLAFDVRERT
jgi:hypothetical protein